MMNINKVKHDKIDSSIDTSLYLHSSINVSNECHFTYSKISERQQNFRKSFIISYIQGPPYLWQCTFYQVSEQKKNSEIENLLVGLIANDTITIIKSIYSLWPPIFLMTDFNLPWKTSQESFLRDQCPFS